MVVRARWAMTVLVTLVACGGDDWAVHITDPDVPLVVATHGSAAPLAVSDCVVHDYLGARDHPGPDF